MSNTHAESDQMTDFYRKRSEARAYLPDDIFREKFSLMVIRSQLNANDRLVCLTLAFLSRNSDVARCEVGIDDLSDMTGLSNRSVIRSLKRLRSGFWLHKKAGCRRDGATNTYWLRLPPVDFVYRTKDPGR